MSLQIWLPLNGNAVNNGLSEAALSTSNLTYNSNGKMGKCLETGIISVNAAQASTVFNPSSQSICFWYYNKCTEAGITTGGHVISGNEAHRQYAFFAYPNNDDFHYSMFQYTNSSGTQSVQVADIIEDALPCLKWTHICLTNDNGMITFYINGKQNKSFHLGKIDFDFSQYDYPLVDNSPYHMIQDFRVYDHCLSPREIHEVYKSLVLHYPLKNTIKKYWNYIWNHTYGIYNNHAQPASLTKLDEDYCGCDIYQLTMTVTDETKLADFQTNLWAHGIYGFSQVFKANTKYCFTILYRPVTHANIKVGGTASNIGGWTALASHYYRDGWYRVGQTRNGTVAEDKTDNIHLSFCCSDLKLNEAISIDFCCPCLLEGRDTVEEDDYYEQGFSGEVIDDCSGFGNNGSAVWDTTPAWNDDSIKYKGCYEFNGNDSIISMSNFSMGNLLSNQFTVCFWVYSNDLNDRSIYFGDYQFANGSLFAIEKTASNLLRFWWAGNPDLNISAFPIPDKTWCHVAVTVDVPGSVMKCYKNGDCVYTYTTALTPRTAASHPGIGRDNRTGATAFRGKLSDFRIYATALSESDIQELYSVRASVLTDGTLMVSGEVIEK